MHGSALTNAKLFFELYCRREKGNIVADIGAQDVNGSLRLVIPEGSTYVGLDFVEGEGVDIVIRDPYVLPLEDASVDVCTSSSCFEHSEFFWLLFQECLRVLKPDGLLYLNVPSNAAFHRYPVDCWRFYPDSGLALEKWGRVSGYNPILLESYLSDQMGEAFWNDMVCVFVKDAKYVDLYPDRILDYKKDFTNGYIYGHSDFLNYTRYPQDIRLRLELMQKALEDDDGHEKKENHG